MVMSLALTLGMESPSFLKRSKSYSSAHLRTHIAAFRSSAGDTSRTLDDYLAGCTEGTISSNLRHCSSPSDLDLPCRCASKKPSRQLLTTCSPRSGAMILPPNRVIVSDMTKGASVKLKCPVPLTERISTGIFPLLSAKSIHVF